MEASEFERKLRRLNPRIYLGKNINTEYNKELFSTGIYYKDGNNGEKIDGSVLDAEGSKLAQKYNESPDLYLTFCTYKAIPEGNLYDDKGHIIAPGWREILLNLGKKNLISINKARKVFQCPSLGLSTYDNLSVIDKFKKYHGRTSRMDPTRNC